MSDRIFLLSPSRCTGRRAAMLLRPKSEGVTARRLSAGTLTLGETFAFMSGLYFRGKLAYGRAFGRSTVASTATLIITPSRGLMDPDAIVSAALLEEFAAVEIDAESRRYRDPLERDVSALADRLEPATRVVLLGSVATGKYVDVLSPPLGDRLVYPSAFIGRGDMSRGGLLLRQVASGEELEYEPLRTGTRIRGARPPKLPKLR